MALLAYNQERVEQVVSMWNNPPYPSVREIAQMLGVSHQRVHQILSKAREKYGLHVLTSHERTIKRREERRAQETAERPKCQTCGKVISRLNKYGYCTKHRHHHPAIRRYLNERSKTYQKRQREELKRLRQQLAALKALGVEVPEQ